MIHTLVLRTSGIICEVRIIHALRIPHDPAEYTAVQEKKVRSVSTSSRKKKKKYMQYYYIIRVFFFCGFTPFHVCLFLLVHFITFRRSITQQSRDPVIRSRGAPIFEKKKRQKKYREARLLEKAGSSRQSKAEQQPKLQEVNTREEGRWTLISQARLHEGRERPARAP